MTKLRVGTRGSKLALAQTDMVIAALVAAHPHLSCDIVIIETTGDKTQKANIDLHKIGGKGLFADMLTEAMDRDEVDMIVHSMKDLPSIRPPQYTVAAMLPREDVRDSFLCNIPGVTCIEDLPQGAIVGTSAPRRAALVKSRRPDLKTITFRGNVPTRIEKLNNKFEDVCATFLARAGLIRVGLGDVPQTILEIDDFLPACGQAAIGVEVLSKNAELISLLRVIDHAETYRCVMAERACLAVVDGDCKTSIGAYAFEKDGQIFLRADLYTENGDDVRRTQQSGTIDDFMMIGERAGQVLLAMISAEDRERYAVKTPHRA